MHSCTPKGSSCQCPHHFGISVLVILFGITFLLQATGVLSPSVVAYIWPSLVIVGGLYKLVMGMCSCCGKKEDEACGESCEDSRGGACGGEKCSTEEACCTDDMKGSCCEEEKEEAHSHEEKK